MIHPASAALIRQQLTSIEGYVQELHPFVSVDLASYRSRPGYRRAAEQLIQIVIECAIDTTEAVLEACGEPPTPSARAAFRDLASAGVVRSEMADLFARRYVGLRNRIVHDYAEIDDGQVLEAGFGLVADARRFGRTVADWVDRQVESEGGPTADG